MAKKIAIICDDQPARKENLIIPALESLGFDVAIDIDPGSREGDVVDVINKYNLSDVELTIITADRSGVLNFSGLEIISNASSKNIPAVLCTFDRVFGPSQREVQERNPNAVLFVLGDSDTLYTLEDASKLADSIKTAQANVTKNKTQTGRIEVEVHDLKRDTVTWDKI